MDKIDINSTEASINGAGSVPAEAREQAFAQRLGRTAVKQSSSKIVVIGGVVAILLGLGTGYIVAASNRSGATQQTAQTTDTASSAVANMPGIKAGEVYGSKDVGAFKDSAEGVVLPGGIGSEGSHHIVRAGGASQNVYLTSSVVDLKMFENAKVKVYGETFKAQKAGWLMDVGRVEVEDLNAPLPDWAQKQTPTNSNPQD